ncbi:MAG: MFS transporter, partial [Chloroflexota bacterium]|nr:MFS transporter [Chloroflexota bacterium]
MTDRNPAAFWFLGALVVLFLFAASAPSPLYPLYQERLHFSPITLTAIYAVYAAGGLASLLTTGRLSDHLGRRPVVAIALVIQLAGMAAFIVAEDVATLFVARTLQGVATGIAIGALSAWLLDLAPGGNARLGSLVSGIGVIAGLGSGALVSSILAEVADDPVHLVYWLLVATYVAALLAILVVPDVVRRRPGWLASMRPDVGVPRPARRAFVAATPSLIATWALGGLYLSLGPTLAISLVNSDSRLAGGAVIAALAITGAVTSSIVRDADPRPTAIGGSVILIGGVAVTLGGVALASPGVFYAGSFIAGVGFGPAFAAVVRSVGPLAPPERRGALLAAVYIVTYCAFSIP